MDLYGNDADDAWTLATGGRSHDGEEVTFEADGTYTVTATRA